MSVIRRFVVIALCCAACDRAPRPADTRFESIAPEASGVTFANRLPEDTSVNFLKYLYFYNGGGVAAGDVDGDGLPDLYFTSNLGRDRLYRNLGGFRFEDVSERAGIADSAPGDWKSGVTMADVNGDGHLDIYVSGVRYRNLTGRNRLYINNGDGTFTERAREYGLDHAGYGTQALFFDYDADGDLDVYLLTHSTHSERLETPHWERGRIHPRAGDRLLRNDGGRFTDVSAAAGIIDGIDGYGLGVVASDVNLDGCIDLYVANDFQGDDHLFLNNCDGTFTESIRRAMPHTSRFSMGVDAADFDNDGRPDLVVLDMLPEREDIFKTTATAESRELFVLRLRARYHPQYARNTLHWNRGGRPVRFSDIGYFAGIAATDWSWAPLLADFDNDGRKDLFVTNGIYRRPNDLDYIAHVGNQSPEDIQLVDRMPQVPLPNHLFRNNGDLTFTNVAAAWGLGEPGFSNGAAYVDLDNDGALDLVVNNVNAPATIYRNRSRERPGAGHYVRVVLRGAGGNTAGIGATVSIVHGGKRQLLEQMPTRGFQSSVDPRLHFGLGAATRIDTLLVIWPDRRFQVLTDVAADQTITLSQQDARGTFVYPAPPRATLFADVTDGVAIPYRHRENAFTDFDREPLMPHLLSTEGPALAVGDVDGDGRDDVFVGGAKWQAGRIFLQQRDGSFRPSDQPALRADSLLEDVDAVFFDADGDGDLDLYVVSGGNEFWGDAPFLRDRLYLNDGRGTFAAAPGFLPDFFQNGSVVLPADFDGDGDVDLFVGSRVVARGYGLTPRSYLLENDGSGRFRDVTAQIASGLAEAGMVSSAAWVDYDGDGALDLIVAGEWMPVRAYRQESGRFVERTREAGLANTNGWWHRVEVADLNGDGRPDLVLGNLGLNSFLRASPAEPVRLYVRDFFRDGRLEFILTSYRNGVSYPLAGRDELVRAMPPLRARYPTYASFGAARLEDILPAAELRGARVLEAYTFASAVALNRGDGTFTLQPLPPEAQVTPIYAALARDFDGDGHVDLLVAGNFSGVPPVRGAYDAGYGLLLRGDGRGGFAAVDAESSGVWIAGEVRRLALLARSGGNQLVIAARNNDRLHLLRIPRSGRPPSRD